MDESETGAKGDIYKNNTEWELANVTAVRIEVREGTCRFNLLTGLVRSTYNFFRREQNNKFGVDELCLDLMFKTWKTVLLVAASRI